MAINDRRGQPQPDNHPLKGGQVIFGQQRPKASAPSSTPVEQPKSAEVENLLTNPRERSPDIPTAEQIGHEIADALNSLAPKEPQAKA